MVCTSVCGNFELAISLEQPRSTPLLMKSWRSAWVVVKDGGEPILDFPSGDSFALCQIHHLTFVDSITSRTLCFSEVTAPVFSSSELCTVAWTSNAICSLEGVPPVQVCPVPAVPGAPRRPGFAQIRRGNPRGCPLPAVARGRQIWIASNPEPLGDTLEPARCISSDTATAR